ncbi:beta strand repeat-containing protein [Nostoc sp.]|uniref:beta strand repeat-containing protein n=1 Tax=Nostoc sp. TaxID=1180 RepID=UPI002FF7CE73
MKNLWQNFNIFGWGLIGATLVLQPTSVQAQYIQRSFLNPSFESPVFGSAGQQCYVQVSPSIIPGWETTHGSVANGTGSCTGYTSPGKVPLIEIWTTGFNGGNGNTFTATTPTSAGNQFAELNAEENSELYQNICLLKNETITFSFLHRGRGGDGTTSDVANFLIGLNTDPTSTVFGTFSTTNNGTVRPQPVAQNGATIPNVSNNNAGNGWVRYAGTVPYTGASGNRPVGFAAISTASGNNTVGNFLDEVQFAGKPVVEFTASSGGAAESETTPTTNPPKLRVVGLVPTGGISVPISVSGTAVLGTDYDTKSHTSTFNIIIPAGNYDGSDGTSVFTIPFTVINNNIPQGVRTIVFTIQSSTSFFASSTTTCGGSPTIASSYTIYDDDFLSGKVWNDADNSANGTFTNINTGSETGTNAGGLLNAILVDSNNKVLKTTTVAADGTYTFIDVPLNQSNVKILLSTTAGTVGNTAPTASLPPNWVNTSPLTTAAFNTGTSISSKDFGIEQLPDTTNLNPASQTNPGGTATVQVPTLAGTDPEDGTLGSGNKFKIVTLPTNGTLTYNNVAVTAGQVISSYNPTLLKLDPQDGAITVSFTYAAIDAASKEDPTPATVTIPFVTRANVLLVKRITAINGDRTKNPNDNTPLNAFVDDTTSTRQADDNNANWKSGYLLGAIDGGKVKPGDEIEYTIYFLNAGSTNANTVRVCDRISANQNFKVGAYGTNKDIQLQLGTSTVLDLTSANDTSDRAQLISTVQSVSANCYLKTANDNGTLVIDVTGNTGVPNLTTMPGSTGQGSPNDSYGFLRFVTKVKP